MEGGGAQRAVVDLLVEQVECADVLVLNKMDTLDEGKQDILTSVSLFCSHFLVPPLFNPV